MLVGLHVATNFEMYRQNSEKALLGGGGQFSGAIAPPPPNNAFSEFCRYISKFVATCKPTSPPPPPPATLMAGTLAMPRKPIYDLAGNLRAKRAANLKI